jgi:hypothetical protein
MHKPLTRELTLPLQQPLAGEEFEEATAERYWEPTVRVVVYDDAQLRSNSGLPSQAPEGDSVF